MSSGSANAVIDKLDAFLGSLPEDKLQEFILKVVKSVDAAASSKLNSDKLSELGVKLMKTGKAERVLAERGHRYTLAQLMDMVADKLYDGRDSTPVSSRSPSTELPESTSYELSWFASFVGAMIAIEGLIAAGKSEFCKKLVAVLQKYGILARYTAEPVVTKILTKYYDNPDLEAYASQLFFSSQRANSNDAAQAFAGRTPSEYPINEGRAGCAFGDRTSIGDAIFAAINHLVENMLNDDWDAVLASYSNHFAFTAVLFMDVSAVRAEFVCKELRKRPSEQNISLDYFEKLRLGHYAMMRALALRGAPVLYTYCDDKPMSRERIAFLDPEATLKALAACPRGDEVKALWADTPEPVFGKTTEADVSKALEVVRLRYESYHDERVRAVAHVKVQ